MKIIQQPEEKKCEFCGRSPATERDTVLMCSQCYTLHYKAYLHALLKLPQVQVMSEELSKQLQIKGVQELAAIPHRRSWFKRIFSK